MKRTTFFLLFTIILISSKISAQWNPVNDLPLTEFSTVYFADDTIYAASGNKIYKSGNDGKNWAPSNVLNNDVDFISAIIKINNRLLAGTYNYGVFESRDNGNSWSSLNNGFAGLGSNTIIEFAKRGDSVYAGTDGSSIFVMHINDNKWYAYSQNIPMNHAGTVVSIYNFNGRLISGSGSNANIYYNDLGNTNWYEVQFAIFDPGGTSLLGMTQKDGILYGAGNQGLYQSTNNGLNWESYNPGIGYIGSGKLTVYNNTVFAMLAKAGSSYYLYKSTGDWQNIEAQNGVLTYNFIIKNDKIYAARLDGLYYRTVPLTSIDDRNNTIPAAFELKQNYSNPFNPSTNIRFTIPEHSRITLKIYDVIGNEVRTLIDEHRAAGDHEVSFDATGLASGVYYCRLTSGNYSSAKKMVLLK